MEKNMYQQPSVLVTDIAMVQTLCASGGSGSGSKTLSPMDPNATTDLQL